jgi:hypothetical protein
MSVCHDVTLGVQLHAVTQGITALVRVLAHVTAAHQQHKGAA